MSGPERPSYDPERYLPSVLDRVRKHISRFADAKFVAASLKNDLDRAVRAGRLSSAEASAIVANFERFTARAHRSMPEPTADELAAAAFVEQLQSRQGTKLPDFDALYAQRAELDRMTDGHDHTK